MKVFVVEDDVWYADFLKHHLSMNPEFDVSVFYDGKSLLKRLKEKPDVITLDYNLPDFQGNKLLSEILSFDKNCKVVMISAQEDVKTGIELVKNGAYDYLVKDDNTSSQIWKLVHRIEKEGELHDEITDLKKQLTHKTNSPDIVGNSKSLKRVFDLIAKTRDNNINVSISGDTGTGKELVAHEIHANSKLSKKKYIVVNISSLSDSLIESELFGHEAGAFTGAIKKRIGYFEQAHGGTLFLDEIAELPLTIQTKLLRVLQEKKIVRVGGNVEIKTNFRLITATHKNLEKEVAEGRFREDLFYRIKGLVIDLPPLKERGEDIILLANHFIKAFCNENKLKFLKLSTKSKEKLLNYDFPGNVRELKSIIELACVLGDDEIQTEHIKISTTKSISSLLERESTMQEYEISIIKHYLNKYDNKVLLVAKKLNIGKSKIYRLLKEPIFKEINI